MSARGLLLVVVTVFAIGVAGGSSVALAASGGAPSLLGEWHMDTIQPGEVPDTPSTVNNTDGLQIYGAQQVAGRFGQAFSFNGADRDFMEAEGAHFQPSQITLMAWVKASSSPGSYKAIIAKGGDNDCGVASYALYTGPNGGASFYIATSRTTTVSSASVPPADIWDGHWHALVGTYDGSHVRLYLDGALVGSATPSDGAAIDYALDEDALSVGDFEPCSGFSFTGDIDEVRVYNGALSDAQAAQVSSRTATTPPELTGTTTTASLTTLPSPTKGGNPILSAARTTGATQLLYDINGDHKSDIALSPSMPYTQLILPKGGSTTVTLKAVGAVQQQVSTASTTFHVPSFGLPAKVESSLPQISVSSSSPSLFKPIPPGAILRALCIPDRGRLGRDWCQRLLQARDRPQSGPGERGHPRRPVLQRLALATGLRRLRELRARPIPVAGRGLERLHRLDDGQAQRDDADPQRRRVDRDRSDRQPRVLIQRDAEAGALRDQEGQRRSRLQRLCGRLPSRLQLPELHRPDHDRCSASTRSKDVPVIGGFPLNAGAELAFAADNGVRKSVATLHVELPSVFDVFGSGDQPSGAVSLAATNTSGLSLDTLNLSVPNASIGGIGLSNLLFTYNANGDPEQGVMCPAKYWSASANVYLGAGDDGSPGPAILMSPPPFKGIRFCQGSFSYLGADVDLGAAAPELFPGVFLDGINFQLGLKPTVLIGGATLSAAQITQVKGSLLAVFPTRDYPSYTLTAAAAGSALQDLVGRTFTSTSFAVGGAVAITVPGVGDLNIAHGGAVYSYPDYIGIGAKVDAQLGIFVFHGSLGGQFALDRRLFELDASADICVRGFTIFGDPLCGGGLLVASEKGAVACVNVVGLNPGVGVKVNGTLDVWLPDGCKPSRYWSAGRGSFSANARYAHAAQAVKITVAKGESAKSVKLVGSGGAPHVEITGPGGQTLSIDGDDAVKQGALQAISASTYSTTWIGLKDARPGTYTISPLPDSVPIASLAETRPGYDSDFSAKVSGRGSRLTLHYDARKRGGGQRVTFFEDGANVMHPLITSTGGTGTVHFTPAPGAPGTRTIVASATVDGSPIRSQTLARFHFAGTVKTGRPGKVTVRRKGGSLLVKWTAAAGATRYGVLLTRSDGAQQRFTVAASHRSLRVGHFPLTFGGRVSISARGVLGDWGAARKSKSFKATKRAESVLLTHKIHRPAHKKR